ncbi:hypothetical protein CLV35_2157 [Motilibacter peucedani]|uniref:Uncharacterized protein n=1 Tax=Motilibacter peucedani TaxID=598650 RepID=A0A420XQX6_9ACTN|nr:hypothetical protein [Motilibacter peucedani]RKS75680.1 hypothetical protein CLV35_2157 [Motilibacter peucedani]
MELLDSRVELVDSRADVLPAGHDLLDSEPPPLSGTDTFTDYVDAHGTELVRLASAVLPDPSRAVRLVVAALAAAHRDWAELTDGGRDPHVAVVRELCRRLPSEDELDWTTRPHPRSGPLRDALWRMMPRDRLAGALALVLRLDEHEVAVAMRTRWLDAVAPIARARARGPELLEAAGVDLGFEEVLDRLADEVAPVPDLATRALRAARVHSAVAVGGAVLAVAALVGGAVGASAAGFGSSPAPAAAPSSTAVPLWLQYARSLQERCPEPAAVGRDRRYGGTPLRPALMLAPEDLGQGWLHERPPTRLELPVALVPGHYPIAPANQSAAESEELRLGPPSTGISVSQVVLRYGPGSTTDAVETAVALLECRDPAHEVLPVARVTGSRWQGVGYHHLPRPGAEATDGSGAPSETYELLVRVGDRLSLTQLVGPPGRALDSDLLTRVMGIVATRLSGRVPRPLR